MSDEPREIWTADIRPYADRVVVALAGELDLSGLTDLRRVLNQANSYGVTVEVDLAGVRFMDSSGISALIGAYHGAVAGGHTLTVTNPGGQVRRVLQITGVLDLLATPQPSVGDRAATAAGLLPEEAGGRRARMRDGLEDVASG